MYIYICIYIYIHKCQPTKRNTLSVADWSPPISTSCMYTQTLSPTRTHIQTHTHTRTSRSCPATDPYKVHRYKYIYVCYIYTRKSITSRINTHERVMRQVLPQMMNKIIGLFCKRTLQKRLYSAKETYN